MLPDPVDARPIEVVLFVQVYVVPLTAPLKLTAVVDAPLHNVWLVGAVTVGVGLTVIVKFCGLPTQLFADGVTVTVAVTGALVVLLAENELILPEPVDANPIEVVLFVHV